jgi:hypothetical protein
MRAHPLGANAAIVGTVHEDDHHFVQMTTGFGGRRIVDGRRGPITTQLQATYFDKVRGRRNAFPAWLAPVAD